MRQITLLLACFVMSCSNGTDATEPDAQLKNGSRLRNRLINAEDGTVAMATGLNDTQLNIDCSFALAEDGKTRCLPFGAFLQATYFLDSNCTQTFAYSDSCAPAVKYVTDYSGTTCGTMNRVSNLTAISSPPANVYYKSGVSCTSVPNGYLIYRMYTVGSAVGASTFVAGMAAN